MNPKDNGVKPQDEAENVPATTPVTEQEASVETPQPKVPVEPTGETPTDGAGVSTEESAKKGASQRIRELNARAKEAEAKAQSLAEKMAQLTGSSEPSGNQPIQQIADEPLVAPGEEIDALELDRRLKIRENRLLQRTDALVSIRNKQNEAVSRINTEAIEAVRAYPELDPENDSFNKELSETVTEAVEAYVKADPYNASVKKFVGRLMRPYQAAVAKEVGQASENIAKQVSQTALRPTAIRKQEKPASEKSIAELEKELGMVNA